MEKSSLGSDKFYNTILSYNTNKKNMEHFYQNIGEDWFTFPNLYRDIIKKYGNNSHFVEVGSWKGRSASFMGVEIHNSGLDIKFDCVDTWNGSAEHQEMDVVKKSELYVEFLNNISPVIDHITPIRKTSLEASQRYQDNSLDFVFIDASHQYQDVLDDIKSWLPKLKNGGTLAGHDYGYNEVNKAVNEFFKNKNFVVSEDCWIHEKNPSHNNKITLVTGLWDIKREALSDGWNRSYQHYLEKFSELLQTPYNLIIYGDEELEKFVFERRTQHNTQFIKRGVENFSENEFYQTIQKIRTNPDWYNLAGWLKDSTQGSLELYNPLVMSKVFLLNDARLYDKFGSEYIFWIDSGLTNTVHNGYFTGNILDKLPRYVDKFSFICFPYEANTEIHGFEYKKLCEIAEGKVNKVARGGFFGGPTNMIGEVNGLYYHMLKDTLNSGYMGTEESIFTILLYKFCEKFNYFEIEGNGLVYKFFDDLGNDALVPKTECKKVNPNFNLNMGNTALYIITYNSPKQVATLIESMYAYDSNFVKKPKKFLLNNSLNRDTDEEYRKLCEEHDIVEIKKDNIGICGGRQFIAEHADENGFDFYFFFEDDMFFYPKKGEVCRNGFNRYVDNLYNSSLQIIKDNGFDFLKLSYSEFFGDNGTQWAWYNVPQSVRDEYWSEYPKLPVQGTDPNAPRTVFKSIRTYNKIPYVSGEIYYSNWPQVVSKEGNRRMFIDTKFHHPFEQTWMSFMIQETKKGKLNPGLLLLTPTEHDRFEYYDGSERREN